MFTLPLKEDKNYYAGTNQRAVLIALIRQQILTDDFFLTGGTALSVFYLHHRISNDLDFFTTATPELSKIVFQLKSIWTPKQLNITRESSHCISSLIENVKVDFVIDPLSFREKRHPFRFETGEQLKIDTLRNINSNKLYTIVSRNEPKDFIDFFFLNLPFDASSLEMIFQDALKKDAIFEDPPTVAYQIEEGWQFLKNNPQIFFELKVDFNQQAFDEFYEKLTAWLYQKIR